MAIVSPNPSIQDLHITFHESTLISPATTTTAAPLFLCPIDQILNYSIPTAFFFPHHPDFPQETVVNRLRTALEKVLLTYDFVAGRLKLNQDTGLLEIDRNATDAGAGFVVASSKLALADLGDLIRPNPAFRQLAPQTLDSVQHDQSQPLFILQVTSFKCGGFAIGMSVNHILLDGISARDFKHNLASQAFDDGRPLAVVPCLDRRLLAARSPPQVSFPHPEFFKPKLIAANGGPPVFDCAKEDLDFKVFRLTPSNINLLKDKAKTETNTRISSYSVVAALIWRCKALSAAASGGDGDRVSALLNVIDIRSRVEPPLPETYCGNGVLVAQTAVKCGEMGDFGKLVAEVAEAPKKIGNEYARSAVDWLEVNKGLPCGEYMVSSWLRLGFEEVEFPWGKAAHVGPVVNHRKDICWVFPTDGGVINALVALPPPEMERFEARFREFFSLNATE